MRAIHAPFGVSTLGVRDTRSGNNYDCYKKINIRRFLYLQMFYDAVEECLGGRTEKFA